MGIFCITFGLSQVIILRDLATPLSNPLSVPSWIPVIGLRRYFIYWPALSIFIFGGIIFLGKWWNLRRTLYVVTDQQVMLQKGWLSRSATEVLRSQVREALVHQGFTEKLLRVGDVEVRTEMDPQGVIMFRNVANPRSFERALFQR